MEAEITILAQQLLLNGDSWLFLRRKWPFMQVVTSFHFE